MSKVTKKEMTREEILFKHAPIWKSLLKMALPSMVLMLVFGSYFFFDSVLSINLAADSYKDGFLSSTDQVRLFMNGYSPINSLMIAVSLLFGMGISTRVSINLGAGRKERALGTIKTGNMMGLSIAIIMVPILVFTAKPWIASQYDNSISTLVSNEAFRYAWPVIMSFPFMLFNQTISSLLRVEARNKQLMIALITPIFINLFGDWLFMGPLGMGVEGGAWATFISTITSTTLFIFFILRTPNSIIKFKNMFGLKFRVLAIVGIILVGIAPFLRNMAMSITSTVQMAIVKDVSSIVYKDQINVGQISDSGLIALLHKLHAGVGHLSPRVSGDINTLWQKASNPMDAKVLLTEFKTGSYPQLKQFITSQYKLSQEANFMTLVITGAMPVYALFFPVMFSFAQASRPIAAYNYGAKDYARVKATYWWTTLYASVAATIIYFIVSWGISGPLMDLLKVKGQAYDVARKALQVIMLSMISFSFAISGMVLLGSTDRILFSVISSSLQGLILFWPIMFSFKEIAINNPGYEYLFWWAWPIIAGSASIVITVITAFVLHKLPKKEQLTLDERIMNINEWLLSKVKRFKRRSTK